MDDRKAFFADWSRARPIAFARDVRSFVSYTFRRFWDDGMSQAAGSLTYSTLLALVPLLVIAFAILSSFPAFDTFREQIETTVFGALAPEAGGDVAEYLARFTRSAQNLTTVGTIALAFTAVLLLSTIESTLNQIWRVEKPRPLHLRLLIFWAILTMGPLLLGASFSLTSDVFATIRGWGATGELLDNANGATPWLGTVGAVFTQSLAFAILFKIVPARRVRMRHAAIGGVLSGIAFEILRWGFKAFLTSGSTYQTIYGAVAVFPLFLVWIYSSWTVVILGAVVAAALPDWVRTRDPLIGLKLTPAHRLTMAIAVLSVLYNRAQQGGGVHADELTDAIPIDARDEVVDLLGDLGYVVHTEGGGISLARDLHTTKLADLVDDLGISLASAQTVPGELERRHAAVFERIRSHTGRLAMVLEEYGAAEDEVFDIALSDLVVRETPDPSAAPAVIPRTFRQDRQGA